MWSCWRNVYFLLQILILNIISKFQRPPLPPYQQTLGPFLFSKCWNFILNLWRFFSKFEISLTIFDLFKKFILFWVETLSLHFEMFHLENHWGFYYFLNSVNKQSNILRSLATTNFRFLGVSLCSKYWGKKHGNLEGFETK